MAFEDGDPRVIAAAVGDVARRRGMTAVAAKAGFGRESLYKALSRDGNPGFATVVNVLAAMDFKLYPLMKSQEWIGLDKVGEAGWSGGFTPPRAGLFVLSPERLSSSAQRASDYRQRRPESVGEI